MDERLGDNPPSISLDNYAPRALISARATPGLPTAERLKHFLAGSLTTGDIGYQISIAETAAIGRALARAGRRAMGWAAALRQPSPPLRPLHR